MDAAQAVNLASALYALSDIRLKESVVPADIKNGFKRYVFNYIGDNMRYLGVMAQDVQKFMPSAVKKVAGYLMVDYSKLGFDMEEISW
jgi:hypothetical protein